MKTLSVSMQIIDNMSAKLAAIANVGRTIESSFQNIERSMNASFGSIERGSDVISQSFERTSESAASLASSVGAYGGEAANAAGSANSLASSSSSAETSLIEAANAAEDAAEEIGDMGEQAEQAGDSSEEFGERSARAMDNLNSLLVSGGIVAAVHKIAEEFAECAAQAEVVETSIAQLQTIAGGGAIGTLSEELMELSNDTGQAAEGLADTAYNAISAGTAAEESVEAASQANQLAVAGFTDTSSALSVLETAMNSYGEAAGGMEHVSDSLITVQNLGVTTVAQLAAQMGKAISTASAYNVSLENLESGYISVTKAGISTAEGTTYLSSMLNELGNSGSEISKLLKEETGNTFGELMNEGKSLADVLGIVYDACDNNAEAMMNMWGSAEAGKAANAIIGQGLDKFNENLTTLREGAGTTAEAYAIMAGTTAYAHNKMDNAMKNTSVQIGEVLNPTLTKLYAGMEEIYTGIGNIVKEHPVIVKAIAAATIGVAAFAGGIATYTAATTIATAVQTAFNGAMLASPVFWIIGGVAALTAGVVFLASTSEDATDVSNDLTVASQRQKEEMEALNAEYETACEEYGKLSPQASRLKYEVDKADQAFNEHKQTMQEYVEECEGLVEAHKNMVSEYEDNLSTLYQEEIGTMSLIQRLEDLAVQSSQTATTQTEMEAIINELNGSVDGLNLSYDDLINNTAEVIGSLKEMAQQQAKQEQYQETYDQYVNYLKEESALSEKIAESKEGLATKQKELAEAEKAYNQAKESNINNQGRGNLVLNNLNDTEKAYGKAQNAVEKYQSELDSLEKSYDENISKQEEILKKWGEVPDASKAAGDATVSAEEATKSAIDGTREKIEKLVSSYNDTYNEAKESVEGQYTLWEKVDKKVLEAKTSVDKIGKSLDSQIQYWENYSKNLDNLRGRDVKGLDDVLKNMDDGSEESAAALAGMSRASDKELEKIIKKYDKLQNAQGKTAKKVADLETDFNSSLGKIESSMKKTISNMTMESDASNAAKKTIQSYINSIRSGIGGAQSAAQSVADAVARALRNGGKSNPSVAAPAKTAAPKTIAGHASGTTDSEEVYVAGEEGPELILSGGGDTVFPTSETDKIISAVSERDDNWQITQPTSMKNPVMMEGESEGKSTAGDRTITLRLEGSGSVQVGPGSSKEDIWNNMKGNIKSTFMNILREEVFEEGAEAFEF